VSELSGPGTKKSQASQKEPDGGDLDEGFTTAWQTLIIASQATISDQPTKGALNLPTLKLELKAAFGQKPQDWLTIHESLFLITTSPSSSSFRLASLSGK